MSHSSLRRLARSRRRGFTLVELVIVVAVIAILAALLTPVILGMVERARIATARASLAELAHTMKRVRDDSGYWPFRDTVWSPAPNFAYPEQSPGPFTSTDNVMASGDIPSVPGGLEVLPRCTSAQPGVHCWNGPYLSQDMGGIVDPWGNTFYYAYIRPFDGWGGGIQQAPNGIVMVWSAGPDGVDQTGCSTNGCGFNATRFAQGLSSAIPCSEGGPAGSCSDDIVQFVATSLY